jgi:hypothetical protein
MVSHLKYGVPIGSSQRASFGLEGTPYPVAAHPVKTRDLNHEDYRHLLRRIGLRFACPQSGGRTNPHRPALLRLRPASPQGTRLCRCLRDEARRAAPDHRHQADRQPSHRLGADRRHRRARRPLRRGDHEIDRGAEPQRHYARHCLRACCRAKGGCGGRCRAWRRPLHLPGLPARLHRCLPDDAGRGARRLCQRQAASALRQRQQGGYCHRRSEARGTVCRDVVLLQGGLRHCGRCGTCVERREAFHLAGVTDPTEYDDADFWKAATSGFSATEV